MPPLAPEPRRRTTQSPAARAAQGQPFADHGRRVNFRGRRPGLKVNRLHRDASTEPTGSPPRRHQTVTPSHATCNSTPLSRSRITFRGRRLGAQHPSGAAAPTSTNPDGREAGRKLPHLDSPRRRPQEGSDESATDARSGSGAWVFTRLAQAAVVGRGRGSPAMPPRRETTLGNAAIAGTDPTSELGFHPDPLFLSRGTSLASLNQPGEELVAPRTSAVDHQTPPPAPPSQLKAPLVFLCSPASARKHRKRCICRPAWPQHRTGRHLAGRALEKPPRAPPAPPNLAPHRRAAERATAPPTRPQQRGTPPTARSGRRPPDPRLLSLGPPPQLPGAGGRAAGLPAGAAAAAREMSRPTHLWEQGAPPPPAPAGGSGEGRAWGEGGEGGGAGSPRCRAGATRGRSTPSFFYTYCYLIILLLKYHSTVSRTH
jgi:hypothetical protein